jgi:hypothetical protein
MKYKVIVVSGNSYNVKVTTKQQISSINVNSVPSKLQSLNEIGDVDVSNIQNNYVMMYDVSTQTFKFVHPSEVLDRADDVNDDSLDYGSY